MRRFERRPAIFAYDDAIVSNVRPSLSAPRPHGARPRSVRFAAAWPWFAAASAGTLGCATPLAGTQDVELIYAVEATTPSRRASTV